MHKHGLLALAFATLVSASASAERPYVVLRDDGTLNGTVTNPSVVLDRVMELYDASGAPRPDVLSVWTTFNMDGSSIETLFDPASNDVKGIGLESAYGGDGTFDTGYAPLRAILLHNNVLQLEKRANVQHVPIDGFARYLFLLELSHAWGPAIRVPTQSGAAADALIGFPFHWSFWMDAGGSPAGGNHFVDNGDGTFKIDAQTPKAIQYSMLDLYLMGFADASEVEPFGVLENVVPPSDVKDPFTQKLYSKTSFPWFQTTAFTVQATRRTFTIADVIGENGPRSPDSASSQKSFKLGIALVVGADASDSEIEAAEAVFDPISLDLAPAFGQATRGRGTMDVVTHTETAEPDAGNDAAPPPDAGPGADAGADVATVVPSPSGDNSGSSGCALSAAPSTRGWWSLLALALTYRRRAARSGSRGAGASNRRASDRCRRDGRRAP